MAIMEGFVREEEFQPQPPLVFAEAQCPTSLALFPQALFFFFFLSFIFLSSFSNILI